MSPRLDLETFLFAMGLAAVAGGVVTFALAVWP